MAKLTKAALTKAVQQRTGLSRRKAQKALKQTLEALKVALQKGKQVDLGKAGRLVVVKRERKRVIRKNLKGKHPAALVVLHKRHPRSVRLVGGKDFSEDPKPTIIHPKEEPNSILPRLRRAAIAFPAWRRRRRFDE